jgi:hypothetical protein
LWMCSPHPRPERITSVRNLSYSRRSLCQCSRLVDDDQCLPPLWLGFISCNMRLSDYNFALVMICYYKK